jgi:hypothetical protein
MPVKTIYYNKKKQKYRMIQALQIKTIDGYPTMTKQEAKDLITGGKTVIITKNTRYNTGLPSSVFRESSLKNPPKKWLKGK